jgi:hypothetical protein
MTAAPYLLQDELVRDRLHAAGLAVAARLAADRGDATAGAELAELARAEASIAERVEATRAAGHTWPLDWLRLRLGLTPTEDRALWLLLAHELAPRTRAQLRALATEAVADVTLDVLRRVVHGDGPSLRAWRELAPEAPLFALGLVERVAPGAGAGVPEHRQTLRVARRLLALAHGHLELDPELAGLAERPRVVRPLATVVMPAEVLDQLHAGLARGLVIAAGTPGAGRRTALVALAGDRGLGVLEVDARRLATDPAALRRQLRAVARECRLLTLVPLIRHLDALAGDAGAEARLAAIDAALVAPLDLVMATAAPPGVALRWSKPAHVVRIPRHTSVDRARLWSAALGVGGDEADRLASTFPLAPAMIHAAGRAALAAVGTGPLSIPAIRGGIRGVLDDRIGERATRIEVTQGWDDLVLPPEQSNAIVELLARVRERGRVYDEWGFARKLGKGLGLSALFSGPPGTGKTMVAGLVARELGLELYQADLAALTSKWIGETEKHLAALFDAADAGQAVLLFDEADALFARRTEVRTSTDRYANLEVNYLLQRLESFTGICILTTNHEHGMDEAFRRRLALHVRFPMPDPDERARLWAAMLPAAAPIAADLGFAELAERFVMSGGHIRNAVLRAAFLAADAGRAIGQDHLDRGARLEYEAMGKLA